MVKKYAAADELTTIKHAKTCPEQQTDFDSVVYELEERRRRSNNVMMYNVPEYNAVTTKGNTDEDISKVNDLQTFKSYPCQYSIRPKK
ncbi:hypothetical protein JTB14_005909 [Gonioctena quinquepunctata]|nr:hypothetical protein JTB14_005909 [Gonioctena quinquepunctata]